MAGRKRLFLLRSSGESLHVASREGGAEPRPEKEHWKQIEALAILFERYPDQRAAGVKLVLMGGARHPADEQRVVELRELAQKRGVEVSPARAISITRGVDA